MTIDLNDPLDDLLDSPIRSVPPCLPVSYVPFDYSAPCSKCGGSGKFVSYSGRIVGNCFACKGQGKKTYKTAPDIRAKAAQVRSNARLGRAAQLAADVLAFRAANPDIALWLDTCRDFDFAGSMRQALAQWGTLTANQIAACNRCILGRANAKASLVERQANAPAIDIGAIESAFAKASKHLKAPRLHLDSFTIKYAGATSKNAGALYVTDDGEYLGKIMGGKFIATRACGAGREAAVLKAAIDPQAATIRYGRLTGRCGCCNAPLSNPESVARGIGPICAERFF